MATKILERNGVSLTLDTYSIRHVRNPSEQWGRKDFKACADQWLVEINGQTFDYYTGIGHRKLRKNTYWGKNLNSALKLPLGQMLEATYPVAPEALDVLYSLFIDASIARESFEDWCADLGYDTDSRQALETYLACQESGVKLRKAKLNMKNLEKLLEDY